MQKNKQYYNIKEVSKILNLKEHVIRHWDSLDPKTNKLRIEGLLNFKSRIFDSGVEIEPPKARD